LREMPSSTGLNPSQRIQAVDPDVAARQTTLMRPLAWSATSCFHSHYDTIGGGCAISPTLATGRITLNELTTAGTRLVFLLPLVFLRSALYFVRVVTCVCVCCFVRAYLHLIVSYGLSLCAWFCCSEHVCVCCDAYVLTLAVCVCVCTCPLLSLVGMYAMWLDCVLFCVVFVYVVLPSSCDVCTCDFCCALMSLMWCFGVCV
jgi:hypothetical protein